jgi:hypothetical protein
MVVRHDGAARAERARAIGLFRYQLVREAADPGLSSKARGRLVRSIAAAEHTDPFGRRLRVSRDTLDRWIPRPAESAWCRIRRPPVCCWASTCGTGPASAGRAGRCFCRSHGATTLSR